MFRSEQGTYCCSDYLIGSLLSTSDDPPGDVLRGQGWSGDGIQAVSRLSEVEMKAICESSQADGLADVSLNVTPLMTEPLSENYVAENYNSLNETAGLSDCSQYLSFEDERPETPGQLNHWMPKDETISTVTYMNMMEWQRSEVKPSTTHLNLGFPIREVINNKADVRSEFHGKITSSSPSMLPSRTLSRKATRRSKEETENRRRFLISERLRALQELLPAALKVNQNSVHSNRESVLDNSVGYIKCLEHQLKDLTASRLGGESTSASLFFLEGHGHYYPHDKLFEESLEEVFGGLLEENPTAASKLLESKGLHMVPIDSIQALCGAE